VDVGNDVPPAQSHHRSRPTSGEFSDVRVDAPVQLQIEGLWGVASRSRDIEDSIGTARHDG